MEQINLALTLAKKYYFWIVFVVILLVAVVCWWMATATLAEQFKVRKTKLEGDFKSVMIQRNHPNQGVISWIDQQHNLLKQGVFSAWEELYREQKSKNPFPKVLGEDLKKAFESLKPKEELGAEYRDRYQNFIMDHFPSLQKLIDVRRPVEGSDGGKAGPGPVAPALGPSGRIPGTPAVAGSTQEWTGTVSWNDADYLALQQPFLWQERPSTIEILMAQEDLWVVEALLSIIKNTNAGATGYSTASVKRIDALQIGHYAVAAWKEAEDPVFKITMPIGGGPISIGMSPPTGVMGIGGAGGGAENTRRVLFEGRYVDDKGQPLAYDAEYPYVKHPFAEFKMMPIRMKLMMDQRRLPKLLVECANSSMPIHVRRIRILKELASPIDLATGGNATGGGMSVPGGMPRPMPMSPRGMQGPMSLGIVGSADSEEGGPYDIPVEVHGVIYIYNPPDRERLGTGTAAAEKAAGDQDPADAPAAEAPAAPPAKPATDAPEKTTEEPAAAPNS